MVNRGDKTSSAHLETNSERLAKRPRTFGNGTSNKGADDLVKPYFSAVNRSSLDFDLLPVCSVSLATQNVHLCLICGRRLHGRAPTSPAFSHALNDTHPLFLNLATNTIHLLPQDIPVTHSALSDIPLAHRPLFTPATVHNIDSKTHTHSLPDGVTTRTPGAVAIEVLHSAAPSAVLILHLFLRPPPIRNALLLLPPDDAAASSPSPSHALPHTLAAVCRSLWTPISFRPHVSPHTFLHMLMHHPQAKPALAEKTLPDPAHFLAFLLNASAPPPSSKKARRSAMEMLYPPQNGNSTFNVASFPQLVRDTFSGRMTVTTVDPSSDTPSEKSSPFWFLSLDLPPKPLFKHHVERDIIPQVSLESLLQRYGGSSTSNTSAPSRTLRLTHAPPFLFLVLRRFIKSKFALEKNPAVVHLPDKPLDLGKLCDGPFGRYKLVGALSHQGSLEKGQFCVAIFHESSKTWFDVTDVAVEQTLFQLVSLADNYILLYARCEERSDDDSLILSS